MTFFSVLIAVLLERIAPRFVELRRFDWLRGYSQWLVDVLQIHRTGGWMSLGLLLLPLLLAMWLLTGVFEHALFGVFELVFNVAVVFLCLGPRDLDQQIEGYLDAIELGDTQQRFKLAAELTQSEPAMELPNQALQVSRSIFVHANTRIYAILLWFTLLGPVAAVLYRLLEQLMSKNLLPSALTGLQPLCLTLLGWIDWIPARLSLFAFMISGSFDDGLQAYRRGSVSAVDPYEQNHELLQQVGLSAIIASPDVAGGEQAMLLVRKARGLILRALVVWLLLVMLLSLFV